MEANRAAIGAHRRGRVRRLIDNPWLWGVLALAAIFWLI